MRTIKRHIIDLDPGDELEVRVNSRPVILRHDIRGLHGDGAEYAVLGVEFPLQSMIVTPEDDHSLMEQDLPKNTTIFV